MKNWFKESNLNRLGWKIVAEQSGSRKIKEVYTMSGKPENERLELLYGRGHKVIMVHRFDDSGKCIAAEEANIHGRLVPCNPNRI